jgi:8-oxo-dGTP pyrophosphatase MutT (NUDIX family)
VTELRIREAVRALVIDHDDRILLVRWLLRGLDVWGTPGGGMDEGEDVEQALRRELDEELGIGQTAVIGPQIWERTHIIPFINGLWDGQHDRFFLVRTPPFDPRPQLTAEQLIAENLVHMQWWTLDELVAFEPTETEFFAPRRLPTLVADLVGNGPPPTPIDTGT